MYLCDKKSLYVRGEYSHETSGYLYPIFAIRREGNILWKFCTGVLIHDNWMSL